jgi:hypothetical protein
MTYTHAHDRVALLAGFAWGACLCWCGLVCRLLLGYSVACALVGALCDGGFALAFAQVPLTHPVQATTV